MAHTQDHKFDYKLTLTKLDRARSMSTRSPHSGDWTSRYASTRQQAGEGLAVPALRTLDAAPDIMSANEGVVVVGEQLRRCKAAGQAELDLVQQCAAAHGRWWPS